MTDTTHATLTPQSSASVSVPATAPAAASASAPEAALTHFGYTEIPVAEKTQRVGAVFAAVASHYDVMNDLMSLGVHRYWKRVAIHLAQVRAGQRVLDCAGGSGDLTLAFARAVGTQGLTVLADINASMLAVGRDRLIDAGLSSRVPVIQANAECLPFPDNYFHCVSIAFGLRNVTDQAKALASMARVLEPGGRCVVLEFSKPILGWLEKIYDHYSFSVLPWLGEVIANDREAYQYLAESIRKHPDQATLKQLMLDNGFDTCTVHNLTGGIVAIHIGVKY